MTTATPQNSSSQPVIRQLRHLRMGSPVLFLILTGLLAAELLVMLLGPLVIPDYAYLSLYLGPKARARTVRFLQGKDEFLIYDTLTGWKNRPNAGRGKWQIDSSGARSTHSFTIERNKPIRALFLGSSLTNGGTGVSNDQTISAYVEDSTIEAINFATMLYTLDQMYLAYSTELYKYNANVVVAGLPGDLTDGLTNRYVPFRRRREVNIPFLKPRYVLTDGELCLMPMPSKAVWESSLDDSELIDSLRLTDDYFGEFSGFKRFDQMPISAGAWYFFKKVRNLKQFVSDCDDAKPLLEALMRRLVDDARTHGASVIFMVLPDRTLTFPTGWRRMLPDHYGQMITRMRDQGYDVLDGRQVLCESGRPSWKVYAEDGTHFSPEGNHMFAQALYSLLMGRH